MFNRQEVKAEVFLTILAECWQAHRAGKPPEFVPSESGVPDGGGMETPLHRLPQGKAHKHILCVGMPLSTCLLKWDSIGHIYEMAESEWRAASTSVTESSCNDMHSTSNPQFKKAAEYKYICYIFILCKIWARA